MTINPALDHYARIPAIEPDRKMYCSELRIEPGGGGVNVSRVARRFGVSTAAVVFAGGATGEQLVSLLADEQVAVEVVPVEGAVRENLTVTETTTGRQYRFVMPGPYVPPAALAAGEPRIAGLAERLTPVVVSGSLPPGITPQDAATLMAAVQARGHDLLVDVPGDALKAAAVVGTRLMKPSVNELAAFAGRPLSDVVEIEAAARELLALGDNRAVVVSLGAAGALLVAVDEPSQRIHAPSVRAVTTVGAGDSLVAGIAVALERGASMLEAACFGVAAGSAATMSAGSGLCSVADVEHLLPHVSHSPVHGFRRGS